MVLILVIGISAFVILAVMFVLLWASSREDERNDAVTAEIIIKANTAPVKIDTEQVIINTTQEEAD